MIMRRIVCQVAAVAVVAVLAWAGTASAAAQPQTVDDQAAVEQTHPDLRFTCLRVDAVGAAFLIEPAVDTIYHVRGSGCRPEYVGYLGRFTIGAKLLGAPVYECKYGRGFGSYIAGASCTRKGYPPPDA